MELVCSQSFMKSLARLASPVQSAVKIAMFDLQTNPRTPGFNLEKLLGNDFYSGRINDNLRLIMDMAGDRPVVLYVDNHDDAYRWADNHKLQINKTTGAMQLVDIEHITEQVIYQEPVYLQPKLFEKYGDDYLLALGVPEDWLLAVKESTKENLEWLLEKLPSEAMERLLRLEDGELVPVPRNHDGDPLDHPDSLRHFITVKATDEPAPGDVILFRMRDGAVAKHVGLQAETGAHATFVHAYAGHSVVESALSLPWRRRIVARFSFPEV